MNLIHGFYEKERHAIKITSKDGINTGITAGPAYIELLSDVNLVLHVRPKQEEYVPIIYEKLKKPNEFLCLGRWEDLLKIEEVSIVEIQEKELEEDQKLKYDIYIPIEQAKEKQINAAATVYRLCKKYTIHPKNKIRFWEEQVNAKHLSQGSKIHEGTIVEQDGEDIVFFA